MNKVLGLGPLLGGGGGERNKTDEKLFTIEYRRADSM